MNNLRPFWEMLLCFMTWIISLMATCTRLRVGAILWNPKTKQIVALAYNGSARGEKHCTDVGCDVVDNHCVRCLHAEENIAIWAGLQAEGCWLFLNYSPCLKCCNLIIQMKIEKVFYQVAYGDPEPSWRKLQDANIKMLHQGMNVIFYGMMERLFGIMREQGFSGTYVRNMLYNWK